MNMTTPFFSVSIWQHLFSSDFSSSRLLFQVTAPGHGSPGQVRSPVVPPGQMSKEQPRSDAVDGPGSDI